MKPDKRVNIYYNKKYKKKKLFEVHLIDNTKAFYVHFLYYFYYYYYCIQQTNTDIINFKQTNNK